MLILINFLLHVITFGVILVLGGYTALPLLFILVALFIVASCSHFCLRLVQQRRGNGQSAQALGLVLLFWIAYTAKVLLAMFIADQYWVVPRLIDSQTLLNELPETYFISMLGFVATLLGIFIFPLRHDINWEIKPGLARMVRMFVLICVGLVVKYFLKDRFNLGVPGAEQIQLGVPFLSGILALLLEFGFLFLANMVLFLACFSGNRWMVLVGFCLALANAGIDLRFGSKDTIMYQMVLTIAYLFIFLRGLSFGQAKFRRTARGIFLIMGFMGILVVSFYKYMNFLRYAIQEGTTDLFGAVSVALQSDIAESRSSLVEILNRITGIEAFSAVLNLSETHAFSTRLNDVLDGSLLRQFSDFYLAGLDTSAAFSMTLIGSWYIYGGIPAIIVGLFVTGFVLSLIQHLILRTPGLPHNMRLAFLPIYWIMCVQLMLGGNPTIWIKTMIVTLPFVYLVGRIAFVPASQKNRGFDARHLAANP